MIFVDIFAKMRKQKFHSTIIAPLSFLLLRRLKYFRICYCDFLCLKSVKRESSDTVYEDVCVGSIHIYADKCNMKYA
jgi:hypothetical protein